MTRFLILGIALLAAQISAQAEFVDLVKSSVLENDVAYLRVILVGPNLSNEIRSVENVTTNKISGIVLDLRFAAGEPMDSVAATANLLEQKNLPLAILVNDETTGAAIELAKQLRNAHAGLIFGSSTNLSPDISVVVSAGDEKQFLENPWSTIPTNQIHLATATTNDFLSFPIDHTSEADLVRARIKDGEEDDTIAKPEPQKPFIRDPVLARGMDFIKGEAILHSSRS